MWPTGAGASWQAGTRCPRGPSRPAAKDILKPLPSVAPRLAHHVRAAELEHVERHIGPVSVPAVRTASRKPYQAIRRQASGELL
jgi:hypothetical protein